jgi:hypothetical protein
MYSCIVEYDMTHNQILGCGFVACIALIMPDQSKTKTDMLQEEEEGRAEREREEIAGQRLRPRRNH